MFRSLIEEEQKIFIFFIILLKVESTNIKQNIKKLRIDSTQNLHTHN